MKDYKQIFIRIGILAIMVLLGLTIVFPQWLDLKDMIIAEYEPSLQQSRINVLNTFSLNITSLYEFPQAILSSIHQTIISGIFSKPETGSYFIFTLPVILLWYILVIILYVIFIALTTITHILLWITIEQHTDRLKLFKKSKKTTFALHLLIFVVSLSLLNFTWPFLISALSHFINIILQMFILILGK